MNESAKSTIFVAAALLAAVLAWATRPSVKTQNPEDMVGKQLFPDFDNPLDATSLEIVKFDESTAKVEPFKVAQVGNTWCIPSHSNYPADAEKQLAEAATSLIGLEVLDVAPGDTKEDHELYGVVEPDPNKLTAAATGVGTRVTMRDKEDKVLVDVIVGKEVPDTDNLRYVRRPGQDPVYAVELKTDKLSTKFEDWIEKDLLKLSSWDIKRVNILDYSIDEAQGAQIPRDQIELAYNDTGDPRWDLAEDKVYNFQDGSWIEKPLGENEELDTTKLDDMRRALDDLKIVDVARKPEGLSADLKAEGTFKLEMEALQSLARRGFHVARVGDHVELLSDEGEVHVQMKDGVQYVLRFGGIAGTSKSAKEDEEKPAGEDAGEEDDSGSGDEGVNRYIFVVAQLNPDAIEKPELEPLPEEKPAAEEKEETPAETPEEASASDEKPDEAGTEAAEGETESDPPAEAAAGEETSEDPPAEAAAEEESLEDPPAESGEDTEAESADADESESGQAEESGEAEEDAAKDLKAERARVEKENKRKQEEYDKKVEDGEKKVKELNERFADWYYIISDEVYQKIHLGRDNIVKEKEKKEDEGEGEAAGEEAGHVHEEGEDHEHGPAEAAEPEGTGAEMPEPAAEEPGEGTAEETPAAETAEPEAGEPATAEESPAEEPAESPSAESPSAEGESLPAERPSPAAETPTEPEPAGAPPE